MTNVLSSGVRAVDEIVDRAHTGFAAVRRTDSGTRARWLDSLAGEILGAAREIADDIHADTGKPSMWATIEVERAASIVRLAAREAVAVHPHTQRLDAQPSGIGRLALTVRVPRGPVLALTPFNFPLHLAVHKVAPAIAAGASAIVVPSPRAPRTASALAEAVRRSAIPDDVVTVLTPTDDHSRTWDLITHPCLPVISFTGSDPVGWRIVDAVPRKQVIVELGGDGAAIIAPDHLDDSDLRLAADRIATFAFYNAGQACTSPQRVYVPRAHLTRFTDVLVTAAHDLDPNTDVGPVIDVASADRIRAWLHEAVRAGARVATGGPGEGRHIPPTVLVEPPTDARIVTDEVFGPIVSVLPYDHLDDAWQAVNASRFGLSVGVFTHDVRLAFRAIRELEVGQVVIGDVPTFRSDITPFGGVKDSGRGREGVRAAIDDYTVTRTAVFAEAAL
ncbi:aldehyde dehydrogenase family protein [Gordonia sp. CPCC 206044]|uniref:aldehyde dehydrogenase family protein n=1 Tax=Gordonia sp. CPCC 206044 TaxID=3140793 RepID=UPI003AF35853